MTFVNYAVQYRKLLSELTRFEPILFDGSSHNGIERIEEEDDDNKPSSAGRMLVDDEGTIHGSNNEFSLMWNIPKTLVTPLKPEQPVFELIVKQLADPQRFLIDMDNICSRESSKIQRIVILRDRRIFWYKMELHWSEEKRVVGRIYQFRPLF